MRQSTFPLADKALNGNLEAILRDLRSQGLSLEQTAFRLQSDHDLTVSTATVHRWCATLGIEKATASLSTDEVKA